jgi:hypothetical protein
MCWLGSAGGSWRVKVCVDFLSGLRRKNVTEFLVCVSGAIRKNR